jgi:hypothetical protein
MSPAGTGVFETGLWGHFMRWRVMRLHLSLACPVEHACMRVGMHMYTYEFTSYVRACVHIRTRAWQMHAPHFYVLKIFL